MKMNAEIRDMYKAWQEETGKYQEIDLSETCFLQRNLSDLNNFTFVKGKNKYIRKYMNQHPGKTPIFGSSLKNNGIAAYIQADSKQDIIYNECISFNKDNAKGSQVFNHVTPFLMDRHHIAIIPNKNIATPYLKLSLETFFAERKFGWGENIADISNVEPATVLLPYENDVLSLEIQQSIVEFIEHHQNKVNAYLDCVKNTLSTIDRMEKLLFVKIFSAEKDDEIVRIFNRWAGNKGYDIDLAQVNFSVKRILTSNDTDRVCSKRMGFTPKTGAGDIPWFTIADFTDSKQLRISDPSTKKQTSMKWVKEKVDGKNTGKSEKLKPISKGDVLVSFKLSVGIVKIYENDLPAYCNEAIDILTPNEDCDSNYLAYNCMVEYPKYATKTNNGYTLNDDSKECISIFIPKHNKSCSSLEIQQSIVEFIEDFTSWRKSIEEKVSELEGLAKQYEDLLLAKVFEGEEV